MADVLDGATLHLAPAHRLSGLAAVQCLNGRFLSDAESCWIFRRIQIQGEDVFGFGLELGIGASHITADAVPL
jgi:hypothetical protein